MPTNTTPLRVSFPPSIERRVDSKESVASASQANWMRVMVRGEEEGVWKREEEDEGWKRVAWIAAVQLHSRYAE